LAISHIAVLLATGIGVGFAQGLLGVGGAFIMTPVMVTVFSQMSIPVDVAVKLAFGTSLLVILPTAASGAIAHHRKRSVWWRAAIIMGVSGVPGALLGSTITSQFVGGDMMKIVFGGVVILCGIVMLIARLSNVEEEPWRNVPLWAGFGFLKGLVTGLLGLGGGVIMLPLMVAVLKFKMHRAIGTSTALLVFASVSGVLGYILNGLNAPDLPAFSIGYVHLPTWLCLAATSIGMAQLGARLAHRFDARVLRIIFVILMFYVGLRMIGVFG